MILVGCINGPWQAITLAAAWRAREGQNSKVVRRLLLITKGQEGDQTVETAKRLGPVVSGVNETLIVGPDLKFDAFLDIEKFKQGLYASTELSPDAEMELWLGSAVDWAEALLCAAFPRATVHVFEDGIGTYVKGAFAPEFSEPMSFDRVVSDVKKLFYRLGTYLSSGDGMKSALTAKKAMQASGSRVADYNLFLAQWLVDAEVRATHHVAVVAPEIMRDCLREAALILAEGGEMISLSGEKPLILLGQCFHVSGLGSAEQECAIYARTINRCLDQGFTVYWKGHPRLGDEFFETLHRTVEVPERLRRFPGLASVPLEISLYNVPAEGLMVASAMSTSLYYMPRLLSIPSRQFAGDFAPLLDKTHRKIAQLTRQTIEPLFA